MMHRSSDWIYRRWSQRFGKGVRPGARARQATIGMLGLLLLPFSGMAQSGSQPAKGAVGPVAIDASGFLDARDFGAVCDGLADDTAALQQAMKAGAGTHRTLSLPRGTCVVTTLVWPAGLAGLKGQGIDATVIRRAPNSAANAVLVINGAANFLVADLTFDGNKTANAHVNHDVILAGVSAYTFDHVGAINAKGTGKAYGFGLFQASDANQEHGTSGLFLNCVGAFNDNAGIGGQQAFNVAITGGHWYGNGDAGISWYKPWTAGQVHIKSLSITGNTATGNGSLGIKVSSWGWAANEQAPSSSAQDVHIDNNVISGNGAYGLIYQAAQGTVDNNEITGNGTKDHGETALLFNAISSHAVKNNIHDNQVFFGIDAGGMFQSVVSGNTIRNNGTVGRGNGLNIGGSVGDVVSNNVISNNGRVQIYYARQEAGDVYFPWDSGVSEISGNQVTITAPSQIAMELLGSPQHLVVKDNVFDGPSAMRLVATTAAASEWHGNRYLRSQSDYSVPASEWLVLPDWIETAQIIGGGRISTITTETAAANAGKVVDVVMTNRGRNYTAAPAVSFKGGGCSGVSGAAKLSGDGRVSQVLVTSPGTGCTSPPGVSLSGGGGTGATAAVPVLGTPLADGRQMALRFTAKTTLAAGGNLRLKGGGEVGVPAGGLITFAARSGDLVEAKRNF